MKETYNHSAAVEKAKEEVALRNGEKINVAENEVEDDRGLVRDVILKDGTKITFDFGKLTGNSIVEIKKKYSKIRKKSASMIEEFDDVYYMLVAEYISGTHYNKFLDLSYRDFVTVRDEVRDFLGGE